MTITGLKSKIDSIKDTNSIYLLEKLTNSAGFFANNKKLLYISKDIHNYSAEGIETDYLQLQTHVMISSVKNHQTFTNGYYNLIVYNGSFTDNNIDYFVQLCTVHANNPYELNFREFFFSLIALFQLPTEQSLKNAIGLYGELKFMQYVKSAYNADISNSWHKKGSYSHYDFSNGKQNIEIKTAYSDTLTVTIKHQQIFGGYHCYLGVVDCEKKDDGETMEELIIAMRQDKNAFKGINFTLNLARELKRVSIKDLKELKFCVRGIYFFDAGQINPFPTIPDTVSNLKYKLDVSELPALSKITISSIIDNFI